MNIIIGLKKKEEKDLGYIIFEKNNGNLIGKGPIAKIFSEKLLKIALKMHFKRK